MRDPVSSRGTAGRRQDTVISRRRPARPEAALGAILHYQSIGEPLDQRDAEAEARAVHARAHPGALVLDRDQQPSGSSSAETQTWVPLVRVG